jgi:hypothetical protein
VSSDLHSHQFFRSLAAAAVVFAMLLAALSLWTAIPLSWIYIASMLSRSQFPAGGPYMVLFAGLILSVTVVGWLLARLGALYTRIVGAGSGRTRPIWLKSVRDTAGPPSSSAPMETILIGSVALALLILVIWFFAWSAGAVPNAPLG